MPHHTKVFVGTKKLRIPRNRGPRRRRVLLFRLLHALQRHIGGTTTCQPWEHQLEGWGVGGPSNSRGGNAWVTYVSETCAVRLCKQSRGNEVEVRTRFVVMGAGICSSRRRWRSFDRTFMLLTCTPRPKLCYNWWEWRLEGTEGLSAGFSPQIAAMNSITTCAFRICTHDNFDSNIMSYPAFLVCNACQCRLK